VNTLFTGVQQRSSAAACAVALCDKMSEKNKLSVFALAKAAKPQRQARLQFFF